MNCDYTDPGGTPLERLAQQQAGNHPAPCARSCEANAYEIQIRQLSAERDALAAKLAELEGQKPALYVQSDHVRHAKFSPFLGRICQQPFDGISQIAYYARPAHAQPVNARLLEALKGLMALSDHRVDLRDQAKAARSAITSAEAQQERLLQDMHDAGREAAITEAVAPWKSAVIDQLVIAHILTAEHESDPLKALQDLLAYHTEIAVDPRVSGAAATLVEQAKAEEREACAKVCDELFPPPSEQMTVDWAAGTVACANAIRARGQK